MDKILDNIYGTKEYGEMQKRLYEEEQKNIYNSIGLPLVDKIMKHSYIPHQMSMLVELINKNIPKQYMSSPSGFKNIPLGKGFGLDIQQGGNLGQWRPQFEGDFYDEDRPSFPVDYGINLKKEF